jgi:hypothetical protein
MMRSKATGGEAMVAIELILYHYYANFSILLYLFNHLLVAVIDEIEGF